MILRNLSISLLVLASVSGCASNQPVTVTTEHKGKTTIVHHRFHSGHQSVDKIDAISANGSVTSAEIHVFDVGRLPDGRGGVIEAHREYRVVQDQHPNMMLPKHVSSGPKTVYTPPNYSPLPADQRVGDAISEIKESKDKLDAARDKIEKKIAEDNNLRGELNDAESDNQKLRDHINQLTAASMDTPQHKSAPTPAELAAQTGASDLQKWGQSQPNQ